jgi:hypothetical protein
LLYYTKIGKKLTTKYTKGALNTPKWPRITQWPYICRSIPFQGLEKYTKIGIFGLKLYHLATLLLGVGESISCRFGRFFAARVLIIVNYQD